MKIDCSYRYTIHVQWQTNHVKEEVKSTIIAGSDSRHKPINKMDLQRDRNCSYWKENNNLITAYKPLSWNLCHVRALSNVEFLMSAEHLV